MAYQHTPMKSLRGDEGSSFSLSLPVVAIAIPCATVVILALIGARGRRR